MTAEVLSKDVTLNLLDQQPPPSLQAWQKLLVEKVK
jgi:hypothetical protein